MRYAVPLNAFHEVAALVEAGAGELYCGYQDDWWVRRYGDHDSASRRQGRANLSTRRELERCASEARARAIPLWLALNSRYTEPQLGYLTSLCRDFERMGGTGVIVSDVGLLWRLRQEGSGLRRCLSILAVAQNRATMTAFRRLGVSRVVLPRFVGPEEASALLEGMSGMEAEVMAFFDKCPWIDGYCRHRHGVTYLPREVTDGDVEAPPLHTFDTTYQSHACLGKVCDYLEPYPCAACELGGFERAGVGLAKLGGRGRALDERLRAVRFLVSCEAQDGDEGRRDLYRRTFDRPCSCYYGPSIQSRRAIEPVSETPVRGALSMGSQTDLVAFRDALAALVEGRIGGVTDGTPSRQGIALLVPPLPEADLQALLQALPILCPREGMTLSICVNDLGTLVSLACACRRSQLSCTLVVGTLLARSDHPADVAHFLSPQENPARAIWGPFGEPRTLVYQRPPQPLIDHWAHPSLLEPSAQQALRELLASSGDGAR